MQTNHETNDLLDRVRAAQARAAGQVICGGMKEDLHMAMVLAAEEVVLVDLARRMAHLKGGEPALGESEQL